MHPTKIFVYLLQLAGVLALTSWNIEQNSPPYPNDDDVVDTRTNTLAYAITTLLVTLSVW